MYEILLQMPFNGFKVKATLNLPVEANSIVIFSPGLGSNIINPHEELIALNLQQHGIGTLFYNLLDYNQSFPKEYKNLNFLSLGLATSTQWLHGHSEYRSMKLTFFGSGSGAAVAIKTAAQMNSMIKAVIALSGRLDLVQEELPLLECPILMVTGELDFKTVSTNKKLATLLTVPRQLVVVPGASHLFEEPGKTDEAANIARSWLNKQLATSPKHSVAN